MAAIRAELPVKPLPPEDDDAAPPCDVAFAPERVEVLTKLVLSPCFLTRHKKENCDLSSQKEDDPNAGSVAEILRTSIPQSGMAKQTLYQRARAVKIGSDETVFLGVFYTRGGLRGR